jgi:hypothetical protein
MDWTSQSEPTPPITELSALVRDSNHQDGSRLDFIDDVVGKIAEPSNPNPPDDQDAGFRIENEPFHDSPEVGEQAITQAGTFLIVELS